MMLMPFCCQCEDKIEEEVMHDNKIPADQLSAAQRRAKKMATGFKACLKFGVLLIVYTTFYLGWVYPDGYAAAQKVINRIFEKRTLNAQREIALLHQIIYYVRAICR